MKTFKEYLVEDISVQELIQIEKYADSIFKKVNIDVELTRHFYERLNDKRNKKPITKAELIRLFKQTMKKHGRNLGKSEPGLEAVIKDMETDINMPFVLKVDTKNNELDMVSKTVMRKKDFKTSNPQFKI